MTDENPNPKIDPRKVIFFLFLVALIVYRYPLLFIDPRFYAEEGRVFFVYAYTHSWLQGLAMPAISYYSFFLNFSCTLAAKCAPLAYAPFVTTYLSLLLTLTPIVLVLWGRSVFFNTPFKQGVICLCTLFFAPGEIWISTTCSQFYLCLITFLILIQDVNALNLFQRWLYRIVLGVAAMSGVLSCFLTPLFIVKYFRDKTRENKIQAVIMTALSTAQFSICMLFVLLAPSSSRFHSADPGFTVLNYFYYHFLYPLFGQFMGTKYLVFIKQSDWWSAGFLGLSAIFFVYIVFVFVLFGSTLRDKSKRVIVYSFLIVSLFSTMLSMNMMSGPRYGFMPNVVIAIITLSQIDFKNRSLWIRIKSGICTVLIFTSILVGAVEYKYRLFAYSDEKWPSWQDEIAKWEKDPGHKIQIWPKGWSFHLPGEQGQDAGRPSENKEVRDGSKEDE